MLNLEELEELAGAGPEPEALAEAEENGPEAVENGPEALDAAEAVGNGGLDLAVAVADSLGLNDLMGGANIDPQDSALAESVPIGPNPVAAPIGSHGLVGSQNLDQGPEGPAH